LGCRSKLAKSGSANKKLKRGSGREKVGVEHLGKIKKHQIAREANVRSRRAM